MDTAQAIESRLRMHGQCLLNGVLGVGDQALLAIELSGQHDCPPKKRIGIKSLKPMVALLIVVPARAMSPIAGSGAPPNDTVKDCYVG